MGRERGRTIGWNGEPLLNLLLSNWSEVRTTRKGVRRLTLCHPGERTNPHPKRRTEGVLNSPLFRWTTKGQIPLEEKGVERKDRRRRTETEVHGGRQRPTQDCTSEETRVPSLHTLLGVVDPRKA